MLIAMPTEITQRELRNDSGDIMRRLDRGESFLVTRNGVPVGDLRPIARRRWIPAEIASAAFAGAEPVDLDGLRADLDRDIDPTVRLRA